MVARAPPPREYLGLENPTAANHCFLNAALQVLWSLGPFRERLLAAPCAAGERGELVAALHALFTRYAEDLAEAEAAPAAADAPGPPLFEAPPPSPLRVGELRRALAALDDARFALGDQADAAEALEALLAAIDERWRGDDDREASPVRIFDAAVSERAVCRD